MFVMRVVIAGGSGMLGRALAVRLTGLGHEVVALGRRDRPSSKNYRHVRWVPDGAVGPWAGELEGAAAVVNLAGAGIADKRWTAARKTELRTSRIDSTRSLVAAMSLATSRPPVFIQGSAVGYYGSTLSDRPVDERAPAGSDFLSKLAVEWEAAAEPVAALGARLVIVRTGIVLSSEGGALPPMAMPFRFYAGGPVGTGRQYMSWVSADDWVSLVVWALTTPAISGPVNVCAPTPVTNRDFAAAVGRALGRPSWLPAPGFALRLALGEMATSMLLEGQRVIPARATEAGFTFSYFNLDDALVHAFRE
jgi:uncharacterized protein (TIGR01777 family)